LPPELLALWNNGLQYMEHVVSQGPGGQQDAAAERIAVASALGDVLIRSVLHVDEHPVITRFWTFRESVDKALTMVLLRVARHALRLPKIRARPENSKRLTIVVKFFRDVRAQQYLRRLSLCLQLTGIATSMTG